jgi:hypothetical protein
MALAMSGMVYALVLIMLISIVSGFSVKDIVPESWTEARELYRLRGGRGRHHEHGGVKERSPTPLYDDFLDVMNQAVSKALTEQRAVPAYQDFLHIVKEGADKASARDALVPSFDDFVDSLKASSIEATKEPVPSYEEFISVLKAGADEAMRHRRLYAAHHGAGGGAEAHSRKGPFDRMKKNMKKLKDQATGKRQKDEHEKLRDDLRKLSDKNRREHQKEQRGAIPQQMKKPVMTKINALRTQLCWKRPNLMQHEKCLRFLGIHCLQESTGMGICEQFTKKMGDACKEETDPIWREDYCALSEALDDRYTDEDEDTSDSGSAQAAGAGAAGAGGGHAGEAGQGGHGSGSRGESHEDVEAIGDQEEVSEEVYEDDDDFDEELVNGGQGQGGTGEAGGAGAGPPKIAARKAGGQDQGQDGAAKGGDRDHDGIPDSQDAFADDPNEWKDTDGDGIGDNADKDLDGDGIDNAVDVFPADGKEWKDSDHDGIGDNADKDRDGDGIDDKKDAFPDDPSEWKDSDGDGVGDNKDAYPYNPACHDPHLPCHDIKNNTLPEPGSAGDPGTLDKDARRPLPAQGFSEAMQGPDVAHNNYYTWVSDWQEEFPLQDDSKKHTMSEICKENPTAWCKKYMSAVRRGEEEKWW